MNCDRLKNLIKNWYLQVQGETMAPARMVAFMGQHIAECEECLADSEVVAEVDKIRGIVLPPSKVPKTKAIKSPDNEAESGEETEDEAVNGEETEDEAVNGEETEDENGDVYDDNGDDNGPDDEDADVKS